VTLSVRRSLAVLAVGAALVTAGCGESTADRAAVVDGSVITETDLQSAMTEVNAMDPALLQEKLTPSGTLTALVQAPVVLDFLAKQGVVISDSVATRDAADRGIVDPSDSTIEVVKLASAISSAQQSGQLGDTAPLLQQLSEQDVEVNPRYGTYDPESASISVSLPPWIKPVDASK
jgi:hypothetical protein